MGFTELLDGIDDLLRQADDPEAALSALRWALNGQLMRYRLRAQRQPHLHAERWFEGYLEDLRGEVETSKEPLKIVSWGMT